MRIGFDAKRLFLNNRGLGNYSRNLLYGLEKYHPGNDYHLYSNKLSNEYVSQSLLNSSNIHSHTPSGIGQHFGSLWRTYKIGSTAQQHELDIYHGLSHEIPMDYKKSGAKVLVTVHDLIFLKHKEFYKTIDRWIYTKKVKFAAAKSDRIIAISEQTKNDIINEIPNTEDKISIVYQSCNEIFYSKRDDAELSAIRKKWNLPEDYMLYVGALNENKNIRLILQAMALVGSQVDLPLVVVGHGDDYKDILKTEARTKNLMNRLIFASELAEPSPQELSGFYQMASLFIFPSHYEGFGIPILEARFSGAPVIASNSSCLHEAGGEKSLYFSPNDPEELSSQMLKALASTDELTAVYPEKFKLEPLTQQMIDLYKSL
jgi:glycosyltransferase involved in cell wall biosynthesis